jgi:hypothetical protein
VVRGSVPAAGCVLKGAHRINDEASRSRNQQADRSGARAHFNARAIRFAVAGGTVTLPGHVDSIVERSTIEHTACNAPGVRDAVDSLVVGQARRRGGIDEMPGIAARRDTARPADVVVAGALSEVRSKDLSQRRFWQRSRRCLEINAWHLSHASRRRPASHR